MVKIGTSDSREICSKQTVKWNLLKFTRCGLTCQKKIFWTMNEFWKRELVWNALAIEIIAKLLNKADLSKFMLSELLLSWKSLKNVYNVQRQNHVTFAKGFFILMLSIYPSIHTQNIWGREQNRLLDDHDQLEEDITMYHFLCRCLAPNQPHLYFCQTNLFRLYIQSNCTRWSHRQINQVFFNISTTKSLLSSLLVIAITFHFLGIPRQRSKLLANQTSSISTNVPKGYLAVYVGESQKKKFVIPVLFLNQPSFQELLRAPEEEFGFNHPMGGLTVRCRVDLFDYLTSRLNQS